MIVVTSRSWCSFQPLKTKFVTKQKIILGPIFSNSTYIQCMFTKGGYGPIQCTYYECLFLKVVLRKNLFFKNQHLSNSWVEEYFKWFRIMLSFPPSNMAGYTLFWIHSKESIWKRAKYTFRTLFSSSTPTEALKIDDWQTRLILIFLF